MITKEKVYAKLKKVDDPELHLNIVDLFTLICSASLPTPTSSHNLSRAPTLKGIKYGAIVYI